LVAYPDHPPGRGEAATVLTHGGLLGRNAIWNLLSQVAPLAVAVMTIPVLIRGLGTDRFGVLTLVWMVLGYFSLFDFGLGRALTKLVAERLGLGLEGDIPDLIWTALGLMIALGLAGAALVILIAPWLVRGVLQIPGPLQCESLVAFYLLAASLPFLIITAGLRGVMEAYQRVGLSNLVRAGVGLFALVGPLLVLPFARGLGPVVAILVVGRLASWAIHLRLCLGAVPGLRRGAAVRSDLVRPLLSFCGWLTLTNIVVPIMVQMDRFFIGALVSTAAVAYYTTPFELVIKGWFIPGAVLGAVFPAFATSFACDRGRTELIFVRTLNYIFIFIFPITLALVALAPEGLALWLGPDFARQSTAVLRWLAIGVFLGALQHVPSSLMQGVGRPDLVAKLHLVEVPPYLLAAWHLIVRRGIEGAALAWTGRMTLSLFLFFVVAQRVLPGTSALTRRLAWPLGLSMLIFAVAALPLCVAVRSLFLLIVLVTFSIMTWRLALGPEEKALLLNRLAMIYRSAAGGKSKVGTMGRAVVEESL
jgi:O-antigen/teichoic acid export membrane protein